MVNHDMSSMIDLDALAAIGLGPAMRSQLACGIANPAARAMRLVAMQREHLLLHDGCATHRAQAAPPLLQDLGEQGESLAVGDWVLAQPGGDAGWWISCRLLPYSQITRRTVDSRAGDGRRAAQRQVLVSNVDTALLVMGLDADFNPRRLERYLALTRLAGVAAVLVLSKADTLNAAARSDRLARAQALLPPGMPALALDLRQPASATALAPWLQAGQTLVLLGSSGAGKSTLANTLVQTLARLETPEALRQASGGQSTGPARAADSRGRHTTTVRTLLPLPGGACIIDTPGLRALRLDIGEADELAQAFGDVARLAPMCRFRDCRHSAESGCAVRQAVDAPRLLNFHKLLGEARRDSAGPLARQSQVSKWKSRSRDAQSACGPSVGTKHDGGLARADQAYQPVRAYWT